MRYSKCELQNFLPIEKDCQLMILSNPQKLEHRAPTSLMNSLVYEFSSTLKTMVQNRVGNRHQRNNNFLIGVVRNESAISWLHPV